jgi:hypothetical protein
MEQWENKAECGVTKCVCVLCLYKNQRINSGKRYATRGANTSHVLCRWAMGDACWIDRGMVSALRKLKKEQEEGSRTGMICVGMLLLLVVLTLVVPLVVVPDGFILLLLLQRKDRFDMVTVSASPIDPSSLPAVLVLGAPLVVVIGPAMVAQLMTNNLIFSSLLQTWKPSGAIAMGLIYVMYLKETFKIKKTFPWGNTLSQQEGKYGNLKH